jgi:hypothetical protein
MPATFTTLAITTQLVSGVATTQSAIAQTIAAKAAIAEDFRN